VKSTTRTGRLVVTADGTGIVSHAGAALLRELADESGLTEGWTDALLGTYKGTPVHLPGRVLTDLAVTLADGGDCLADLAALRDQGALFGPVASHPTAYRVLDRVGAVELSALRAARADARARVWAAGGGPDLTDGAGLIMDVDASLLTAHSEKEGAAPTYKYGFGFHPLLVFLDRPDVSGGEALAAVLRPGNAGSNTAADHLTVLDLALAQLPEHARPTPGVPGGPQVLIRADSAGATHAFMAGCRERGVRYCVGLSVDQKIQDAIVLVPAGAWIPAINADGEPRGNGEIVELTALLDLRAWPPGSRVICRRERPHPGAQYRFTDHVYTDGHRFQVMLTDTPGRGNDIAALELQQRQQARVEDRIRNGKDRGLRNLPCQDLHTNSAWVELAMTAADLTTWAQALCFTGALRKVEPKRLRYRALHVAGRLVRTGRRLILRLDQDWPWATDLAAAFNRLRAAPWPG
jgi:hypothetical protein